MAAGAARQHVRITPDRVGRDRRRASLGRRTSRSLARFLVATCVGVAATLAWQSYGGTAERMIANSAPQLRWFLLSPSAMNPPSGREIAVEQPTAVQASVPQAASEQAGADTSAYGDGGFNMLMCEFLTAVHHKLRWDFAGIVDLCMRR